MVDRGEHERALVAQERVQVADEDALRVRRRQLALRGAIELARVTTQGAPAVVAVVR